MLFSTIVALSFAVRQRGHSSPIPAIDWNNLPYQNQVKEMADRWRANYHLPGVWCALIQNGRVVACVATGFKNIEDGGPAEVTDHLNVGSVSKVITGTMIANFVARGVISYDTKVKAVFPDLAEQYKASPLLDASLQQILTHTAGIAHGGASDAAMLEKSGPSFRKAELIDALQDDRCVKPGLRFEYSNRGPNIAVAMVEKLTGTSFESWYDGELGKHLGILHPKMLNTFVKLKEGDVFPHRISENGSVAVNTRPTSKYGISPFEVSGACSLELPELCAFALCTMRNSLGLPDNVYYSTTHFPSGLPIIGVVRGRAIRAVAHTDASWGGDDAGFLFHNGFTGQGEYCEVYVNVREKKALIFYTNVDVGDEFAKSQIASDLRYLRSEE